MSESREGTTATFGRRIVGWRRARASLRFDGLWWRRFARLGSVHGPEWWKRLAPPWVAAVIFLVVRRNRRGASANQARVLGIDPSSPAAWLAAYRMFATFARCMTETLEFHGPKPGSFRIDEPPQNSLAWALRQGGGAILVTAHFGNWDVSARALNENGRPVRMVTGREDNATSTDFARELRERAGVQVIFSDSSVFSSFNMIRALRRNEIVAIQVDRGSLSSTAPAGSRNVPFFGAPARFQEGPFHLARVSGAPIVPVFTARRGVRHYEILLGLPRRVDRHDPCDVERALRETVELFEQVVRAHPEQWFEFAPFWHEPAENTASRDASSENTAGNAISDPAEPSKAAQSRTSP